MIRRTTTQAAPAECRDTAFADLYHDADAAQCRMSSGFDVTCPEDFDPDAVCAVEACRSVYRNLRGLAIATECRITTGKYLYRDVLVPLSTSTRCSNGESPVFPDLSVYDLSGDAAPAPTTASSSESSTLSVVGAVVGSLVAVGLLVAAFVWCKKRRLTLEKPLTESRTRGTDSLTTTNESLDSTHGYSIWDDEELLVHKMRAEDIEDLHVLGAGASGIVYLVQLNGDRLLASKRLAHNHTTRSQLFAFVNEIKLVATLEHPSIVSFVGVAWTKETDLQALFEFMPNGDLCSYLSNTRRDDEGEVWDLAKLQFAIDIVEALVYVHSFVPPLVHRDLKSRNVLLGASMEAKLSDFGVSRYQSSSRTMTMGVGTSRWLAPEVITGGGDYNERCDIYSFGMVLAELDSHRLPLAGAKTATGNDMPEMAILQLVSTGQLHPTFRASCPEKIREIAMRCVALDPNDRPPAVEIAFTIRTIAKDIASFS